MADPSLNSEPPFITAFRGVSSDVASAVTFDQRLSHFLRLPPIFDRLLTSASVDDRDGELRAAAVAFLHDDDVDDEGTRLLARFIEFVFEEDVRNVEAKVLEGFFRFCAAVVDGTLTDHGVVDPVAENSLAACFRLLYLMQLDRTFETVGGIDGENMEDYRLFRTSLKTVERLSKRHPRLLVALVLVNEDFFRIMISDSTVVSILAVTLFSLCVSHESCQLSSLPDSTLSAFLDELSFKVSSTEDGLNAGTAIEALLRVAEKGPEFADDIRQRYEGLGTLVTRWVGRGFDPSIRRLLSLLNPTPSAVSSESQRRASAAVVIQRTWRGHVTRRRVAKLSRVVSRVQRSFRQRCVERDEARDNAESERERSVVAETERLRRMRTSREKILRSVEALPARDVDLFLQGREAEAATKIQALWKGWKTRRRMNDADGGKRALQRDAAARLLQARWRVWLRNARARKKAMKSTTEGAAALENRQTLAAEVEKRKERRLKDVRERCRRGETALTQEEKSELDNRVQETLWRKKERKDRVGRSLLRCEAALASLDMDMDVILYPSSLDELVSGVQSGYDLQLRQLLTPSTSAAVRSLAAAEHAMALRHAREPWTKLLENEMDEEIDFDLEGKLDVATEKKLRDSPHWKHLAWTLDDDGDEVPW